MQKSITGNLSNQLVMRKRTHTFQEYIRRRPYFKNATLRLQRRCLEELTCCLGVSSEVLEQASCAVPTDCIIAHELHDLDVTIVPPTCRELLTQAISSSAPTIVAILEGTHKPSPASHVFTYVTTLPSTSMRPLRMTAGRPVSLLSSTARASPSPL